MTVRWWCWQGLTGSLLLAGGGWWAGATPGPAPQQRAEALWGTTVGSRLGLLACLIGLVLLGWAWWRLAGLTTGWGRAKSDRGAQEHPTTRWLLITGVLWAAPLLLAAPLASRDLYAYACQGAVWLDGHDPYTTGAASGGCPWLAQVPSLWQDTPTPYGPVALLGSAAAVGMARLLTDSETVSLLVTLAGLRLLAVAGVVLLAVGLPRLARAGGLPPAGVVGLGLVTPLVAVHAVAGGHHDALVAGALVIGLAWAAVPGRWPTGALLLAGLVTGAAVAMKVTAVVAVPFGLLLAARRGWRPALVWSAAGAAGLAGPHLVAGLAPGWLTALSGTGSVVQWSSVPSAIGMTAGYVLRVVGLPEAEPVAVTAARAAGVVAFAVLALVMFLRAVRDRANTRSVVYAAGVVLAAVVLLGPVVYPWYAVAPLAVLAATVRDPIAQRWLGVATLVATGLALPSGLGVPSLTKFPGALLVTGLLSWWGWRWWRAVRRRRREEPAPAAAPTPLPGPRGPAR